jgi:hypothetical protein
MEPKKRFQGIDSASLVAWWAYSYLVPVTIDCSKIPAQIEHITVNIHMVELDAIIVLHAYMHVRNNNIFRKKNH